MRTMGFDAKAIRTVYVVQAVLVAAFMIAIGTMVAVVSVLICGAVGIPIGGAQQLFGDSTLHPWLGVGDVAITAALMLVALVAANLLATRSMFRLTPAGRLNGARKRWARQTSVSRTLREPRRSCSVLGGLGAASNTSVIGHADRTLSLTLLPRGSGAEAPL